MRTHFGDDGLTEAFGGARVSKASASVRVLGELDELNAFLGAAVLAMPEEGGSGGIKARLLATQRFLFTVGGAFYTGGGAAVFAKVSDETRILGEESDALHAAAGAVFGFEPPGGNAASVALNIARAVCRRAEREAAAFFEEKFPSAATPEHGAATPEHDAALPEHDAALLAYLNRLSDYLYNAGRVANACE